MFRKVSDVFRGFGNGLFCVSKNLEVDRLILDGRPANLLQVPPDHYILTMASTSALLGVHLKPHEKLLFSGDDLSNFFYMFKVGPQRASRNFLDWAIPTKLVRDFAGFPQDLLGEEFVYACLNSLAMGDSAACAYAQTSHLAMALQCNALDGDSLLTMHGRAPRDLLWEASSLSTSSSCKRFRGMLRLGTNCCAGVVICMLCTKESIFKHTLQKVSTMLTVQISGRKCQWSFWISPRQHWKGGISLLGNGSNCFFRGVLCRSLGSHCWRFCCPVLL